MLSGWAWVRVGAISGAIAVAAGAFGAHGLRGKIETKALDVFQTAVTYQMFHALALLAVGLLAAARPGTAASVAGVMFLVGTLLFSGSLYGWALGGPRWLVYLTPVGGLAFILGWIALAVAAGPGVGKV
jgi:uncharacterized membrane protein YgdD (TMEM256/DUF423 family)